MRVFLSGMMGTGKSTVGRHVAQRLGVAFVDLDAELEARAGRSVREIFSADGEARFRDLEAELILELSARDDHVVALGGGTVVNDQTRRVLHERGFLVTLRADASVLAKRLESGEGRPLIAGQGGGELEARLHALAAQRAVAYAETHALINAESSPEDVAARVVERVRQAPIGVMLAERSYRVEVGPGALARKPLHTGGSLEVADTNTAPYASTDAFVLEAGEAHKNVGAAASIWDEAIARDIDRGGRFVGVGGGVVGDLTGFAAATYLRGVPFGLVATSVVAMVDSSVGGKTGFNRPTGKNLVGAFHQPAFVICDIDTLGTLAEDEYRSGMAEVVKSVWLAGEDAVGEVESLVDGLNGRDAAAIEKAVRLSIELKARVVKDDEREAGARMLLNLGHTLGHGFEAAAGFGGLRHGDAVALGTAAACDVALGLGKGRRPSVDRLRRLLTSLRLPIDYESYMSDEVLRYLAKDKKRRGDSIRFVVPAEPGNTSFAWLRPDELPALLQRGSRQR